MLRAAVVCGWLLALTAAPAAAQSVPSFIPEPERPINRPSVVNVGLVGYLGSGWDGGFEGDGVGLRAGALLGSGRPLWLAARGTYHYPLTEGDPSLLQWDVLAGRSLWRCDCAVLQDGQLRAQVPVRGPNGRIRHYDARPLQGGRRTFRFASDLVLAGGMRLFMFIGDNPDGSHQAMIFLPQAGLWYHQQHLLAGHPGRLRVALLGAYSTDREAAGLFTHAELALGHLYAAIDAGGLAGDSGGRELSITLGWEL